MSHQQYIYERLHDQTFAQCHIPKLMCVLDLLKGTSGIVLDLGCGDGKISFNIKIKTGARVIGVDVSVEKVKEAKDLIEVVLCDLDRPLPFRSGVFDLCCGLDVIEHIINIDGFLFEIHKTLKDRGKFIIVTPNLASFVERMLLLLGYQPQNIEVSKYHKFGSLRRTPPVGHFRGFTLSALTEMLEHHNFRIEKVGVTTYYGGLLKCVDVFLGKIRKTLGSLFVVVASKQ